MKKKILKIFIILLLLSVFIFINIKNYVSAVSYELKENVFRLHIIANSNASEDQALKLKIRDKIIAYMNKIDTTSKTEVIEKITSNIKEIEKIAQETIRENNFDYDVSIEIGEFYFPTKHYGNISLPAGIYDAIKVKIGKAEGENWWCSLFPPLCFTDISSGVIDEDTQKNLKNNLENEEFLIITNSSSEYKFKFKIIEILNLKNIL